MSDKKSMPKDGRTRNWTFIVYPDSAPENWQNVVDSEHIQWVESPLHEGEMNPDNESEKKAHWHVLLLFDGKKSYEQVKEISDKLNATVPQICRNAKGLIRYFAHMDNPEKKQYNATEIIGHGGADIASYLKATGSARYELIGEMRQWVQDNDCTEFFVLFDYAACERFDDWFPLLCDNSAYIMGEYIKSRRYTAWSHRDRSDRSAYKVDTETGEVIE